MFSMDGVGHLRLQVTSEIRSGRVVLPNQASPGRKTRLIWAKVGIWGGCGEALIKWGHVVGLGYFLALIPSKECGAIGCAINLGRTRNSACRFAHGAGRTRFLRVQSTARVRANILNLPARIFGSEGVSAHFGPVSESNTQKTASFSLEF